MKIYNYQYNRIQSYMLKVILKKKKKKADCVSLYNARFFLGFKGKR